MAGYQRAWSRFRILRIVFFALLIVGFSPLVPASLAQYTLAIEILGRDDSFAGPISLEVEVSPVPKAVWRELREPAAAAAAVRLLRAREMTAKCNPTFDARDSCDVKGRCLRGGGRGFLPCGLLLGRQWRLLLRTSGRRS